MNPGGIGDNDGTASPTLVETGAQLLPAVAPRIGYLSLTVFATVVLYYQLYVGSSVSTLILNRFDMTFTFYVVALAIGSLIGAFGSLLAGDPSLWSG